jgi:glycosyltransferase involved in cell wall biosynthesis
MFKRKTVVYYCQPYFLDSTLETLDCIKFDFDIHLIIEISNDSKISTILDLSGLELITGIFDWEAIMPEGQRTYFMKHFSGLKSIKFMVFSGKRSISVASFLGSMDLYAYVNAVQPLLIHFDSASLRAIWALPFFRNIKVVSTIHDPIPHQGERTWKFKLTSFVYRMFTSTIFLYSEYARTLFQKNYPRFKKLQKITLLPYHFITQYANTSTVKGKYILFFGRLSTYKGIDILLKAIPEVLSTHPYEQFVIAGNPESNHDILFPTDSRIRIISRHLDLDELANLIVNAKFIVCPYREATQSGVLMTSFALHKSVVASNVGAFPEYINNDTNGLLTNPTVKDFATGIRTMIENQYYEQLNKNIAQSNCQSIEQSNRIILKRVYEQSAE